MLSEENGATATGICTKNLVNFSCVVYELRKWIDKQDRHTSQYFTAIPGVWSNKGTDRQSMVNLWKPWTTGSFWHPRLGINSIAPFRWVRRSRKDEFAPPGHFPSVHWDCRLSNRKSTQPVKHLNWVHWSLQPSLPWLWLITVHLVQMKWGQLRWGKLRRVIKHS